MEMNKYASGIKINNFIQNICENLDEMDKFLEKCNLPKLTQ